MVVVYGSERNSALNRIIEICRYEQYKACRIVNAIVSSNPNEFTDELHYIVAKQFYRYIKQAEQGIITDSYLILCQSSANTCFAFGFDDNDRIFVNIISNFDIPMLTLRVPNDADVKYIVFHYDVDMAENECDIIVKNGRYRVQGDIIVDFDNIDKQWIIAMIRRQFHEQLYRFLCIATLRYLQLRLADIGIASHMHLLPEINSMNLEIRLLPMHSWLAHETWKYLGNVVADILRNELKVDVKDWMVRAFIREDAMMNTIVTIEISTAVVQDSKLLKQILDNYTRQFEGYINELIDNREIEHHKVIIGNHRIEIEALPRTFSMVVEHEFLDQIGLSRTAVTVQLQDFYVLPGCKMTLHHKQHGTKTVIFNNYGVVRIRTTPTDQRHELAFNVAALIRLKKQFEQKNENENQQNDF